MNRTSITSVKSATGGLLAGMASFTAVTSALLPVARAARPSSVMTFSVVSAMPRTLTEAAAKQAEQAATRGMPSRARKTLAFTAARAVRLVVHTGPENDMLSYRIAGLRNPTLVVSAGATLRILFVNDDDDMKHTIRFTSQKPPFPPVPNMRRSVGTPDLLPQSKGTFHAMEIVLHAPSVPGDYAYLCTVHGHAAGGMYGMIRIH